MDAQDYPAIANGNYERNDQGGAAGLMALVILLILMVCTAASLLLAFPQTYEGAATAAAAPRQLNSSGPVEPTFHERYPGAAGSDAVDAPTF
jgi:hypothetical protein